MRKNALSHPICIFVAFLLMLASFASQACGGFFCQLVPIKQADEQIVFRQDNDQITAMVQIQYVGDAENFSWVVPVPDTPEFSVGSNDVFSSLEVATRPVFNLQQTGQGCAVSRQESVATSAPTAVENTGSDSGVVVEQRIKVGPFDALVISSDDAGALARWLSDNDYDLSERGEQLIAPYVEEGMKFVALKLQSGRNTGSIRPIILKYQSEKPVIPIRLTAVAAVEDMGVLVWLVGDARAVPENYLHVTPNYTLLNWYTGSQNAYSSYQGLVTQAMDEAGGQGFATDYAGRFDGLDGLLPSPVQLESELDRLTRLPDAEFLSQVQNSFADPAIGDVISLQLPLSEGQSEALYFSAPELLATYPEAQLLTTRVAVEQVISTDIIGPINNAVDLLDDNRYLTRLYTTLSAAEMTVDPVFVFNPDMPEQLLQRNAVLDANCNDGQTEWSLTLGSGTGRDDVMVINAISDLPVAAPALQQDASWKVESTFDSGVPSLLVERNFSIASLGIEDARNGGSGSISPSVFYLLVVCLGIGLRARWLRLRAESLIHSPYSP